MFKLKQSLITATVLSVFVGVPCVQAQTPEVLTQRSSDAVRVSASGEVSALPWKCSHAAAASYLTTQTVPGAVLDWPLFDKSGATLQDASYDYTLTVTYRSGLHVCLDRWNSLGRAPSCAAVRHARRPDRRSAGANRRPRYGRPGQHLRRPLRLDLLGESERPTLTFENRCRLPIFTSSGGRAVVARGCCDGQGGGALVAQFGNGPPLDTARQVLLAHDSADGRLVNTAEGRCGSRQETSLMARTSSGCG
jgi:hypothetical protein